VFRLAKVNNKNSAVEMKKYDKEIKKLAGELGLKGDLYGLKFVQKFSFLKTENIEQAKKHKIRVHYEDVYSIDEDHILEMLENGKLSEDDVVITKIPDMKKLEKTFEKKKVEGIYELNYAVGLSSLE